jgi:hypothetical protein
MTTKTSTQAVSLCDEVEQADGTIKNVSNGKIVEVTTTDIYADEGKVFKRASDGTVLTAHITLGTADSIDNYTEITTA